DPAELQRHQLAQVRTLLAHAVASVPYYRRVLPAAGVVPARVHSLDDFRRIPLLSRLTCQEQYEALQASDLPASTVAAGEANTTGTSGVPLTVRQTNWVQLWWFAFYLRDLEWCGLDPTGTLAAIRTTGATGAKLQRLLAGLTLPHWMPQLAALLETGPAHGMDIQQDCRQQLAWLRRGDPDYLLSYPTNLEVLADLLREEGRRLGRLRVIQAISETVTEEARARIEAAFGVSLKNTYTCTEAGYLASPCPAGHGLHVHAENVLLEVLDAEGRPCRPGETGQVALTTLHNFRAPFLRYLVGDEATVGPLRCPCGRGLPLLTAVHGKRRVLFRLPGGRRRTSHQLAFVLRGIGGHRQHQVIQRAVDHYTVRVVPGPAWTPEHAARMCQAVQAFAEGPV